MDSKTIENNFKYHEADETQNMKYEDIRSAAKNLAYIINDICPESRERSLALTNLEQATMWANASIARNS